MRNPRSRRLPTGLVALAAALVLALTLAGCGSSSSPSAGGSASASPSTSPTSSTSAGGSSPAPEVSVQPKVAGPTYVAIGDSYTAAPLVPDTAIAPDNPCLRSTGNYPSIVSTSFPALTLVDVSCTGATITSLVGYQGVRGYEVPPQFDALTDDTKLVTVGLGGNAYQLFSSVVTACVASGATSSSGSPSSTAPSCEAKLKSDGYPVATHLKQIQSQMAAVLAGVRDRSPKAKIVLIGYPQLMPTTSSCPTILPITTGDAAFVASVITGLNDALAHAATKEHVPYVDMEAASKGHDICSAQPWVNGIQTQPDAAAALHPFAAEQQAAAKLVLAALK